MYYWDAARMRLLTTDAELKSGHVDEHLPSSAREMLETVAAPEWQAIIQIFTVAASRPVRHRIWATRRVAAVGAATDDGRVELSLADPNLIPYMVAHLVGLRRIPSPAGRRAIHVPLRTYRDVEAGSTEVPELAEVMRARRLSWRVSTALPNPAARRPILKWLYVTDSGPAGLWRMMVDRSEYSGAEVTLTPMRAREVWWTLTREVLS